MSEKNNRYSGRRTRDGRTRVLFDDGHGFISALTMRLDLRNHSPTGFNWGYGGSGPAQLALAILAEELGDDFATLHYQDFKREKIAMIDEPQFEITSAEIREWASTRAVENADAE